MSGGQDSNVLELVVTLNDAQDMARGFDSDVLISKADLAMSAESCADTLLRAVFVANHNKYFLGDAVAERLRRLA